MSEQSRTEEILRATIDDDEYTKTPQSREEELLLELKQTIEEGGGASVVPNPEGEATETLTKLGVNDTVYGIPSGGGEEKIYTIPYFTSSSETYGKDVIDAYNAGYRIRYEYDNGIQIAYLELISATHFTGGIYLHFYRAGYSGSSLTIQYFCIYAPVGDGKITMEKTISKTI